MAGVVYIAQADLELRFTPSVVRRVFCDDASDTPGPRLAMALEVGSRQVDAILLTAFTLEQIAILMTEDAAVKHAACALALAVGCEGRPEWSGEGAPFASLRQGAVASLKDIAKANARSAGETVTGPNPTIAGNVTIPTPHFIFAPTNGRRPGGY